EQRDSQPHTGELVGQRLDAGERACGVGVEEREGGSLELPDDRVYSCRRYDVERGVALADRAGSLLFVLGVAEAPEERHGDRFDASVLDELTRPGEDLRRVEGAQYLAVTVDSFVDTGNAVGRDDVRRWCEPPVLVVDPPPAGEWDEFLEPLRRDEPNLQADPGGEHIGDRGRPEAEPPDGRDDLLETMSRPGRRKPCGGKDATPDFSRCCWRLCTPGPEAIGEDRVGERPSDVDADAELTIELNGRSLPRCGHDAC